MFPTIITRYILSFFLLVVAAGAVLGTAPFARAQVAGPCITAAVDTSSYGVILVSGQNFTPRSAATVDVLDASTSALLRDASVGVNSRGAFLYTVAIPVPSDAPLIEQVTIQATDATQARSGDLTVYLNPPVALVQIQLTGVQQDLAAARTAVHLRLLAVMQARQQLFAANQALAAALKKGAPPDVIAQLRAAVSLAQQQLAAAEQALAVAEAVLAQLQVAASALQQQLSQAQTAPTS